MSLQIYVLRLQGEKWYIGKTTDVMKRFQDHVSGNGSIWTSKYAPVKIEELTAGDEFDEDKITKKYMSKYGIDNVRGGSYVTLELSDEQRRHLQNEINMSTDRCALCGESGHFIKNCPKNNTEVAVTTNDQTLPCERCGRIGHNAGSCYAKTHTKGFYIKKDTKVEEPPKVEIKSKNAYPKRWTSEEEQDLVSELKSKVSFDKIAELHNRSENAVKSRAYMVADKMIKSGKNIDEISEIMGIHKNILEAEIKKIDKEAVENSELKCERCWRTGHVVKDCHASVDSRDNYDLYPIGREKKCPRCEKTLYKFKLCECPVVGFKGVMSIVGEIATSIKEDITDPQVRQNHLCGRCGRTDHDIDKCNAKIDVDYRNLLEIGRHYQCAHCKDIIYHNQPCPCIGKKGEQCCVM